MYEFLTDNAGSIATAVGFVLGFLLSEAKDFIKRKAAKPGDDIWDVINAVYEELDERISSVEPNKEADK